MIAGIKHVLTVDKKLTVNLRHPITSVGSLFQMCGAATAKARLPTVGSLTGGTKKQLASVEQNGRRLGKSLMLTIDEFMSVLRKNGDGLLVTTREENGVSSACQ